MAWGAATGERWLWCAASSAACLLLVFVWAKLRLTPYARVLRSSLWAAPFAVLVTGWIGGWPGVAARWMAFFVVAGWHHSALQALREWTRFSVVIGPDVESR